MAQVCKNLTDCVKHLNTLYNSSSTPPNAGEEDYLIWTDLINIAVDNWEGEEGMMWKELFKTLAAASDGDKVTTTTTSYALPTNFNFPNSAYVWLGDGTNRTPYKVIRIEEVGLYPNDIGKWCYFTTSTLEFNPNLSISAGQTISYNYYAHATAVSAGADVLEMSSPMYAVYYALSELKKEEGDISAAALANGNMEAMKTQNFMTADFQSNDTKNPIGSGFGLNGNYPTG
jgi:hypothetical protein